MMLCASFLALVIATKCVYTGGTLPHSTSAQHDRLPFCKAWYLQMKGLRHAGTNPKSLAAQKSKVNIIFYYFNFVSYFFDPPNICNAPLIYLSGAELVGVVIPYVHQRLINLLNYMINKKHMYFFLRRYFIQPDCMCRLCCSSSQTCMLKNVSLKCAFLCFMQIFWVTYKNLVSGSLW